MIPNTPPNSFRNYTIDSTRIFEFSDLIYAIWKGKWLMAFITVSAVVFSIYYSFEKITPIYSSSAVVVLKPRVDNIASFQSLSGSLTGDNPETNAEIEILMARSLMHDVAQYLELENDPEFNRFLTPPRPWVMMKSKLKKRLGWEDPPQFLPPQIAQQRIDDAIVSALLKRVEVVNLRQSPVFRVTAHSKDAVKAANIADAVVNLYIQNQITQKIQATEQASNWLSQRVGELRVELETAELAASNFSANTSLVSPENLQSLKRQLKDIRERINKTQRLKKASLQTSNDKEADFAELSNQLVSLQGSQKKLSAVIQQQGQDLITLQQLTREAHATRALYEHMLSSLKETTAQAGIQESDSRVLSPAVIPDRPTSPRKPLLVSMAAVIGLSVSLLIIFLKEMNRTTFRSLRALERLSPSLAVAQLPTLPVRNKFDFLEYQQDNPKNAFSNAIRNLRTTLLFGAEYGLPQVIGVTSALFDEDTAPTAIALAKDLSNLGKNVLLIDTNTIGADFRNYFGDEPTRGIISLLKREHGIDQCIHHPDALGADVLFAEDQSFAAADTFMFEEFRLFLSAAKERYDVIILNAPAVLDAPSARAVLTATEAVFFNIKFNATTKAQVNLALRMLAHANIAMSGFLLSQVEPKIPPLQAPIKKASEKFSFSNA